MAIGDVDAAVRADDDVVGLIKLAVCVARFARDPEAQQLLALRTEFMNLMTLGSGFVPGKVGNPDVALAVHRDAVRRHHDTLAEVREHGTGFPIELENRIDEVGLAVGAAAARPAGRSDAAAFIGPDVAVDRIDVDAGCRAPFTAGRQLAPVLCDFRRRVRQSFTGDRVDDLRGALRRDRRRAVAGERRDQEKNDARADRGKHYSRSGHDASS